MGIKLPRVKPLNYSYLFDAGEGRTIVLDINDFQFNHELGKAYERLEIVAGDLSGDEILFNENIKNDGNGIIWMHSLENTERWKDASPMSDEDLRKNSTVSSSQTPRVAEDVEVISRYNPPRYEVKKSGYGSYKRWAFLRYYFNSYYNRYVKYSWYVRQRYGPPDYVGQPLNTSNEKYNRIKEKWEAITAPYQVINGIHTYKYYYYGPYWYWRRNSKWWDNYYNWSRNRYYRRENNTTYGGRAGNS